MAYPIEVREYVVTQVCDLRRPLRPIIGAINAGEVDELPACPVRYGTALMWVANERRRRDKRLPLEDETVDAYVQRLWAVAGGELRKLERDARKGKPLDARRLNELESFATRCRRHIRAKADKGAENAATTGTEENGSGLLERLLAEG